MTQPPPGRRRPRLAPVRAGLVIVLVGVACLGGFGLGALGMRIAGMPSATPPALSATDVPSLTAPSQASATKTPAPAPATVTRTPTPRATLAASGRLAAADQALFDGDWQAAAEGYRSLIEQTDEADLLEAATLGLAKALLYQEDPAGSLRTLSAYLAEQADGARAAEAHFLLGEAHSANANWAAAAQAYSAYLALRPGIIDSYAHEAVASAAMRLADWDTAASALEAAIASPRQGQAFDLRERLGSVYEAAGNTEAALAQYQAVFDGNSEYWRKARMKVLAGNLLHRAGQVEAAHAEYLVAVHSYPEAPISFEALVVLVNDGVTVDELQRGLTNYHARAYDSAIAAFLRYRSAHAAGAETTTAAGDSTALYTLGLTYQATGRTGDAVIAWRELIATYPGDANWARAYMQIAFVQSYPADVQTYEDFVAAAPAAAEAPDALYRAARLCERNTDFARAAALWTRIATEYPDSAQAADAAMQAGLVFFREGQLGSAALRFELASTLGNDSGQHARAWLWIGKVKAAQGDEAGAVAAYNTAAAFGPHGYYPMRAVQLARGEAPFSPPAGYNFAYDVQAEQAEVDAWLRANFPAAQSLDRPSELQPAVWNEPRFVRGAELWRLGRLREAHTEFNSLRLDRGSDPLALWQLAVYFHEIGAYDLGIRSARSVVDLAGYSDSLLAPNYILRLRYPAPFTERVVEAAARYEVHPFLMYAKMRIESFFWKYAFSVADARGLNQIIPTTANDIASQLGMTGFVQDDLFRPAIVIPMGAYYLNFVARITGDNPPVLLAGYYAGPGNAQAWLDISQGDYDLFVEVIRLPDAKGYVQTTFEFYEQYRELYAE